jgi:hypothetical protein
MGTVETVRYVRKPLYVEAIQVTPENFADVARHCGGAIGDKENDPNGKQTLPVDVAEIDPQKQYILVKVHNPQSQRQTKAMLGDWLLQTDRGFKIYSDRAFKDNFDKVKPGTIENIEEPAKPQELPV